MEYRNDDEMMMVDALGTANRVLKLVRRAQTENVGAPGMLLGRLHDSIQKASPLLRHADWKILSGAGIIPRMTNLQGATDDSNLRTMMNDTVSEISDSLAEVGQALKEVLEGVTKENHPGIGDLLERLGEEVRRATEVLERRQKSFVSLSAVTDDEKRSYGKVKVRDCVKRFGIVCGDAKKLLDGIERTTSAFSFCATDTKKTRLSLRRTGWQRLLDDNSSEKPDLEETISPPRSQTHRNEENMTESEFRSWLQRLLIAFASDYKKWEEAFSAPAGIRSWLWTLGEALDVAENLLESAMFGVTRSSHGGGRGGCWCVNIDDFCSSLTTVQVPINDQGWDDLWQVLVSVCDEVEGAVEKGPQLWKKDTTWSETRDEVRPLHNFVKELASSGRSFIWFSANREQDKRNILELMFRESEDRVEVVQMIDGAAVKNALAREVFDYERVEAYFDVRIWMSLGGGGDGHEGELFYDMTVRELIIESSSGTVKEINISTTQVVNLVFDSIAGKRYLLVLDDISYDLSHNLDYLHFLLEEKESSARGSRILVVSNGETLFEPSVEVSERVQVYDLQCKGECWSLFEMSAFKGREPKEFQNRIGREIVESLQRQKLSNAEIMAMGGVLHFADSEEEWNYIGVKISVMEYQGRNYLFGCSRSVKFAYDQLPLNLKQCFDYCSLFPRGHEFDVQTLIKLWMAQGFIESGNGDIEEVGYDYFLNLLRRLFFDEVKLNTRGAECTVHYLMNQLKYYIGGSNSHFVLGSDAFPSAECFGVKARSMLFPTPLPKNRRERGHPANTDWNWDLLISECRFLRALDMHNFSVKEIPDSIGDLKHLRYLDLSKNENLVELPDSITRLLNLQTLKLSLCLRLKELPTGLKNLVNLRHLEIDGCNSLTSLPQGFGKLINLRTLSQIVLSEDASKAEAEVEELKQLGELREVEIKNLRHGMHSCLEIMRKIRCLSIEWESQPLTYEQSQSMGTWAIQLFPDAEELSINGCYFLNNMFSSTSFPNNLRKLHLKRCVNCKVLPSLDNCVNLRMLVLDEMIQLEYISENFSEKVCASLLEVWLMELPKLEGWCKTTTMSLEEETLHYKFSRLLKLVIEDCPNLVSIPLFPTLEEGLVLDSTSWKPFQLTMEHSEGEAASSSSSPLSKLKNLCIVAISSFDNSVANEIKWRTLQNLEMLKLDFVPKLESLPDELQHVTTLRELHIWRCGVNEIPGWIEKLQVLERLVIRLCPMLKQLPGGIINMKGLKILEIEDCQTLLRRCKKTKGADWNKIAHIPELRLGRIPVKPPVRFARRQKNNS